MTNRNEIFSAFLDSELSTDESNEQIGEASQDVNLRYRMHRYQMIGDVMRGGMNESLALDFETKISAEIAQLEPLSIEPLDIEPLNKPAVPQSTQPVAPAGFFTQWFKPLSGIAVVASVAWLAVISLQSVMNVDSRTSEFAQHADKIAVAPQTDVSEQVQRLAQLPVQINRVVVSSPTLLNPVQNQLYWSSAKTQAISQSKLNSYLVTHTEYSTSMQGMIPQVRVAGFDVSR